MSQDDPKRRRPGRPRRSAAERSAAKERRIPVSRKGRLQFRPGFPHALDVQMREARNYRRLIAARLEQLQTMLSAFTQHDPSAAIGEQEAALKAFVWTTYKDHKHRDHILATFLAIRRARLLAKLDAATSALELAADLLHDDDTLLAELRAAVERQRQSAERTRQLAASAEEGAEQTALVRVGGSDEATVQAQLAAIRAERERLEASDPTTRIDQRHLYGDVMSARQQVAAFETQMAAIRAALSPASGWYEEYYVEKVRINRQALKYLKRGETLPPGVELFEGVIYGPYLKYRWQEVTGGPQYTIQMGLVPEDESSQDDEERDSYPNL